MRWRVGMELEAIGEGDLQLGNVGEARSREGSSQAGKALGDQRYAASLLVN